VSDRRGSILLSGENHHYLTNVLRLQDGEAFDALDPGGARAICRIIRRDRVSCMVEVLFEEGSHRPLGPRITLFQCLPKARKMDIIVRQSTECGTAEIIPIQSQFSLAEVPADRLKDRLQRWNRIAREATQQSGAGMVPVVHPPARLDQIPARWDGRGVGLVFQQVRLDSSSILDSLAEPDSEIAPCIGPEGGVTKDELRLLLDSGFKSAYLGERILRCETAAAYALGAIDAACEISARGASSKHD